MISNLTLAKIKKLLLLSVILGIVALISSVAKNILTEKWLKEKEKVACIPANVENTHPLVYRQTSLNPVQSDALVKSFVEEYILLKMNEQLVDYHKTSPDERRDNARLSANKFKLIEMSQGIERAVNQSAYALSNEIYYELLKGNLGWVFLIDEILIYPGQNNGATIAVVRGEYQVTYDKVKADLPSRLWGYREIVLVVQQMMPTQDIATSKEKEMYSEEERDINKHGLFVTWSKTNILGPDQKKKLDERNYDFYMLEQFATEKPKKDKTTEK